jgi:aspartyl aminopeptidase
LPLIIRFLFVEAFMRSLRNSFVVSADMAHALHPNYAAKHDATMAPGINGGMVIKHNANQRYATNSMSATVFRRIGKLAEVPVQEFSVRSDSGCGSTVGPIIATLSGILTVDVGTPQYSMHSIREMMGSHDAATGYLHLKAVLEHHPSFINSFDSIKL